MLPLNHRKTQLEIAKLELEVRHLEQQSSQKQKYDLFASTRTRSVSGLQFREPRTYDLDETARITATVERRLLENPVQVAELDVEFVERLRPPGDRSA
jgi:hypothetical protein